MPIDIDVFNKDRLTVTICDPSVESQVSVLLAGLLTSQLVRAQNFWTVSYHDFIQLKNRLDHVGLVDNRTATDEAVLWLQAKHAEHEAVTFVKSGADNGQLTALDELKTSPYSDQLTGVRFLVTRQKAVLADEMGVGKAQPLDAKVLTPSGWRLMADLHVGDMITGSNGQPTRVTGVFPQGNKEVFKVTMTDGSSTECCEDHLWLVNTPLRKWQKLKPRVKSLRDISAKLTDKHGNHQQFIPLVQPVEFQSNEWQRYGIDPYVLGCLLGNGGLTVESRVGYTTSDVDNVSEIQKHLPVAHPYGYHIVGAVGFANNRVLKAMRDLGLHGLKSEHKFIPSAFKIAPVWVRIAVMQGLLDTDGHQCANGVTVEYSSASEQLALDLLFIIRSLGGTAAYAIKQTECLPAHRLHVALPNSIIPFRTARKLEAHVDRTKYFPRRAITSIVPIGIKQTQCISVEACDQLYVTDDFIVTHNTLQLLAAFLDLKARGEAQHMLVLCPNSVKMTWVKEVVKHTGLSVSALSNGTEKASKDLATYAEKRTDVFIVHYDALMRISPKGENQFEKAKAKIWSATFEALLALPWDVIVLDEAHQVKTIDCRRTQCALLLTRTVNTSDSARKPRVYLATGTPISESPLDAWSVLSFLDPLALPRNYTKFESYFTTKAVHRGTTKTWRQKTGYRNLFELKELLHGVMIRRLKIDIKGMPDKVEQVRYVTMGGEQRRLYDDIKAGVYNVIVADPCDKLSIAFAMTKCMRMRQVLNHPKLVERDGYTSAKYEALDGILDEVLADPMAKAVVWTEWREAAEMLSRRYKQKYGTITLMGGTSQQELANYSNNWDTMPERVAVCTPKFGGTGVDFLQRCRTAIYVEPPYSTILFRQSMDRIHRRVAHDNTEMDRIKASPATLIFMQVEKSIDQLVYDLLAKKGAIVDALLTDDAKLIQLGKADLLQYLR